jgi:hypothetical protein
MLQPMMDKEIPLRENSSVSGWPFGHALLEYGKGDELVQPLAVALS